jgi:hypothetical protein
MKTPEDRPQIESERQIGRDVSSERVLTADDLMRLQLEDDPMMLDDVSLCTLCSYTCASTC